MLRFKYLGAFLLFTITLWLYFPTHNFGIINLDDYSYLYNYNEIVVKGLTADGIVWAFSELGHAIWMPVTWLSYMLDVSLFGEDYGAMHLHNVVIHALNAVLLYCLLLIIFSRRSRIENARTALVIAGFVGAAFWAWHPLRVEPVVWIASRKDVLGLFFELLAFITWLKRLDYEEKSEEANIYWFTTLVCFIVSSMCKPASMTFPLLGGVLEILIVGKIRTNDYKAVLVISVMVALIASFAQRIGGAMSALAGIPLHGQILNASSALGIYCWKTLVPTDLAVQCMNHWPRMPRFWCQGLLICFVYGLCILFLLRKIIPNFKITDRKKLFPIQISDNEVISLYVFCSLLFFLIAVAPTLGVVNFGFHAFADRFTYLPSIGFSILIVAGLLWLFKKCTCCNRYIYQVLLSATGIVMFLIILRQTHFQIKIWSNEISLFSNTLQIDGEDSPVILRALGQKYYDADYNLEKALACLDRSFLLDRQSNENIHFIYCILLCEAGQINDAKREVRVADEIWEKRLIQTGYNNLNLNSTLQCDLMRFLLYANIAFVEGDIELSKEHVSKMLLERPNNTWANYLAGKIALKENKKNLAIDFWTKSVTDRTQPISNRFLLFRIAQMKNEGVEKIKE